MHLKSAEFDDYLVSFDEETNALVPCNPNLHTGTVKAFLSLTLIPFEPFCTKHTFVCLCDRVRQKSKFKIFRGQPVELFLLL